MRVWIDNKRKHSSRALCLASRSLYMSFTLAKDKADMLLAIRHPPSAMFPNTTPLRISLSITDMSIVSLPWAQHIIGMMGDDHDLGMLVMCHVC